MRAGLIEGYALLGGAIAWTVHLLVVYAIGEGLCILGYGGVDPKTGPIFWSVIAVTIVTLAIAGTAAWASRRLVLTCQASEAGGVFIGHAGLWLNALFAWIILAETVPVFVLGCTP